MAKSLNTTSVCIYPDNKYGGSIFHTHNIFFEGELIMNFNAKENILVFKKPSIDCKKCIKVSKISANQYTFYSKKRFPLGKFEFSDELSNEDLKMVEF